MRTGKWLVPGRTALAALTLLAVMARPVAAADAPAPGPAQITLPAQVVAFRSAVLTAKVAGYLTAIHVDKGDRVKAGAPIAEIEVPELMADQLQYRAQLEVAQSEFDRMQKAIRAAPDLVTPDNLDAAQGRLKVAQAQLERINTLLRYARITAPFPGIITARYADPGAYIPVATTADQQSAAVVALMDFSRVRVQVPIPESDSARIGRGAKAVISAQALPGKSFEASVTRISYALDASHSMLAEIELANPGEQLRPGMYASVRFTPKP